MASSIIAGSLALATVEDLHRAGLYHGIATWITRHADGDVDKFVFERVDGGFDTFTLQQLQECAWWRLGDPDDVLFVEALMLRRNATPGAAIVRGPDACDGPLEQRKSAILAEQAFARARLGMAK